MGFDKLSMTERPRLRWGVMAVCALAVSACGGGSGGSSLAASTARSGLASVSGSTVNATLSSEQNRNVQDARVGLVAYVTGTDPVAGQVVGLAGVRSGATVGTVRTTGTASYNTQYAYDVVENVTRTSTTIGGTRYTQPTQTMTLNADFGARTLTGTSSDVTVNGTISGSAVAGTATVDYNFNPLIGAPASGRVVTTLNGNIGSTGIIGAFHGSDSNTVVAGGLVGVAN